MYIELLIDFEIYFLDGHDEDLCLWEINATIIPRTTLPSGTAGLPNAAGFPSGPDMVKSMLELGSCSGSW